MQMISIYAIFYFIKVDRITFLMDSYHVVSFSLLMHVTGYHDFL